VLSGGERSRLAMIRLLLEPVNLLILDEPTNHLDIPSKEVLKEAIRSFDGTAIIVSHDREFLDGLVSKVYAFGGGQVREHLGGIYDYLSMMQQQATGQMVSGGSPSLVKEEKTRVEKPLSQSAATYAEHKEQQKRIKKAERDLEQTEKDIARMEQRIKEMDALFLQPDKASDMVLVTEYTDLRHQLDEAMERWEKQSDEVEKLYLTISNR
jgi:ATP-binding cassette subfamily F protein 3